ncbi:hypothetical protein RUND412_009666 [Rhizina undulata]
MSDSISRGRRIKRESEESLIQSWRSRSPVLPQTITHAGQQHVNCVPAAVLTEAPRPIFPPTSSRMNAIAHVTPGPSTLPRQEIAGNSVNVNYISANGSQSTPFPHTEHRGNTPHQLWISPGPVGIMKPPRLPQNQLTIKIFNTSSTPPAPNQLAPEVPLPDPVTTETPFTTMKVPPYTPVGNIVAAIGGVDILDGIQEVFFEEPQVEGGSVSFSYGNVYTKACMCRLDALGWAGVVDEQGVVRRFWPEVQGAGEVLVWVRTVSFWQVGRAPQ